MSLAVLAMPLLIYFSKILELALNSIRIVAVSKGFKKIAVVIAILEAVVWVIIVSWLIEHIGNVYNIIAFSLGMATGVYVGFLIEERLALGIVLVRVITQREGTELLKHLRNVGFRVTAVTATSNYGRVKIFFATIKRTNLKSFTKIVKRFNPRAFFTVEEVRFASQALTNPAQNAIEQALKSLQLYRHNLYTPRKRPQRRQRASAAEASLRAPAPVPAPALPTYRTHKLPYLKEEEKGRRHSRTRPPVRPSKPRQPRVRKKGNSTQK